MNGKTHQLVGITGGILASAFMIKSGNFQIYDCLAVLAMSSVGSYLPDIDHTGSTAGKRAPILSYPIYGISKMFSWMYKKTKCKIFDSLSEMFAHRGIFHAPLLWALIFIPMFMFIPPIIVVDWIRPLVIAGIIGMCIGVTLHLFADMLNPTGIPLFMPIFNHKFRIGKIVTGSKAELIFKIFVVLILIASCIFAGYIVLK